MLGTILSVMDGINTVTLVPMLERRATTRDCPYTRATTRDCPYTRATTRDCPYKQTVSVGAIPCGCPVRRFRIKRN